MLSTLLAICYPLDSLDSAIDRSAYKQKGCMPKSFSYHVGMTLHTA